MTLHRALCFAARTCGKLFGRLKSTLQDTPLLSIFLVLCYRLDIAKTSQDLDSVPTSGIDTGQAAPQRH